MRNAHAGHEHDDRAIPTGAGVIPRSMSVLTSNRDRYINAVYGN